MRILKKHKIILALIGKLGPQLTNTELMNYLFLYTRKQCCPAFDFVPYKYGCFSFEAYHEISLLLKNEFISFTDQVYSLNPGVTVPDFDDFEDRAAIWHVHGNYKELRGMDLLRKNFMDYPYYAIRSTILNEVLPDPADQAKVQAAVPQAGPDGFYSIGYQGLTLDQYLNELIRQDVRVLAGVRNNPYSMKFGFKRSELSDGAVKMGIRYVSFKELGIESQNRQDLNSQDDYDRIFAEYEATVLPRETDALARLYKLFENEKRVAVTCFEKDPKQCHRTRILKKLAADHSELAGKIYLLNKIEGSSTAPGKEEGAEK